MFKLIDRETKEVFTMRDGKPFLYSSHALAKQGKSALEVHHKVKLNIIPA